MKIKHKLKELFRIWPTHTVLPIVWLKNKGFSGDLIRRYSLSGWIVPLKWGIIARPGEKIDWMGFVWGLQRISSIHVGGKTALEIQGKAHYIKFRDSKVFLFGKPGAKLPSWLKEPGLDVSFILTRTKLLPSNLGLIELVFGDYSLKISNPARAFLEYMFLINKYHSFDESYYLIENLQFLSSDLMQEVLENCTSNKVKRLVLCLARKQKASWFKKLDLSKISLGSGIVQAVKNGAYDPEFKITYPHSWDRNDNELIF